MSTELAIAVLGTITTVTMGLLALVVGMAKYIHSSQEKRHADREAEQQKEIDRLKALVAEYGKETAGIPELLERLSDLVTEQEADHKTAAPAKPRNATQPARKQPPRREGP